MPAIASTRRAPTALYATNLTWPVRTAEDFFPYASRDDAFWTGFYTSRPALKGTVLLRTVRELTLPR